MFQKMDYQIEIHETLFQLCSRIVPLDEKSIYAFSLICEPRVPR